MKYFVMGNDYIVRLDPGDKIMASLEALCRRDEIGAGVFSGLGAVSEAEIAHFDPATNDYTPVHVLEPCEIASLHGNVTVRDGAPCLHAHIALADRAMTVRGGHLREAVVSATAEIVLTIFLEEIGRKKDPRTGLHILDLKPNED